MRLFDQDTCGAEQLPLGQLEVNDSTPSSVIKIATKESLRFIMACVGIGMVNFKGTEQGDCPQRGLQVQVTQIDRERVFEMTFARSDT